MCIRDSYNPGSSSHEKYIVMENKLEHLPDAILTKDEENRNKMHTGAKNLDKNGIESNQYQKHNKIRIGYFGLLRSPWSFKVLKKYATERSDTVTLLIAGALQEAQHEFNELIALDNVLYLGPYKSPDDLHDLYNQVDLVWGCYPEPEPESGLANVTNPDWSWAQAICRSNRFYESSYFKKPIVSMTGSGDGKVVSKFKTGLLLDDYNYDYVARKLDSVTSSDLSDWCSNLRNMPQSVYCYTEESEELIEALKELA